MTGLQLGTMIWALPIIHLVDAGFLAYPFMPGKTLLS